jgi:ribosomal protein L37AE/L43A
MSETTHATDPRTDAPKCTECRTDLYVERDNQNGWICRWCDRTVREGVVRDPVPQGKVVYYLPGRSGTTYHHSRACLNLIQSDRDVLEWTPEIAARSRREPCGTCAKGASDSDTDADSEADTHE